MEIAKQDLLVTAGANLSRSALSLLLRIGCNRFGQRLLVYLAPRLGFAEVTEPTGIAVTARLQL